MIHPPTNSKKIKRHRQAKLYTKDTDIQTYQHTKAEQQILETLDLMINLTNDRKIQKYEYIDKQNRQHTRTKVQ